MNESFGWTGTIIRADLTRGKVIKQRLPEEWKRLFLGGVGINAWILYNEVGPEVKPFDPENKVIFGVGPLCGTAAPSANRGILTTKGIGEGTIETNYGVSHVGGFFPATLKLAGYDHIIVEGRSEKPVYLDINNEEVELKNADQIWGKDVYETNEILQEETGNPKLRVACIGPAGENLVHAANVIVDSFHSASACGFGSILGSKKFKAIAVQGTKRVQIADPERFKAACNNVHERHKAHPGVEIFRIDGSTTFFDAVDEKTGLVPTDAKNRYSKKFWDSGVWVKSSSCYNCAIACRKDYLIKEGPHAGKTGEGYDFNCLGMGGMYGLDPNDTYNLLHEITRYGLNSDAIGVFRFAAWLYEKEIITSKDAEGIQLTSLRGNLDALFKMLDWYVDRRGFANVLAEGIHKAAEKLGGEALKYSFPPTIKGLPFEMGVVLPKYGYIVALAHSVTAGGTAHLKGNAYSMMKRIPLDQKVKVAANLTGNENALEWFTPDGKAYLTVLWENFMSILDSIGICKFSTDYLFWGTVGFNETAELLSAATGLKYDFDSLMEIGERINLIERAFNIREGIRGREHDTIPTGTLATWGKNIEKEKFEKTLDEYYSLRGCNETGVPTKKKLESIGLENIANDLTK